MRYITLLTLALVIAFSLHAAPEGGMYPINVINKLPLKQAGLEIPVDRIFSSKGTGLVKAVVNVGGCTGSFVSSKGLILTNHHCAFSSLQPYSTPENNYLEMGYAATGMERELPIKKLEVKILHSYEDVSGILLSQIPANTAAADRAKLLDSFISLKVKAEENKYPTYTIEIAEMLPNKSYMLFRYMKLKDIRIVYIPPRNVGEFGGETDNWEWPRHTGDFSFLRAYVGPDGKPAEYSKDNKPYQPEEHLQLAQEELEKDDFVFILGYPGRTYRNKPAGFLKQQKDISLPYTADLYQWQIDKVRELGQENEAYLVSMQSTIKRWSNVQKNYRGKLKALEETNLVQTRRNEEETILKNLDQEDGRQFRQVNQELDALYRRLNEVYPAYLWYSKLMRSSRAINVAYTLSQYQDNVDNNRYEIIELSRFRKVAAGMASRVYNPYESAFLEAMFRYTDTTSGIALPEMIRGMQSSKFSTFFTDSLLLDTAYIRNAYNNPPRLRELQGQLNAATALAQEYKRLIAQVEKLSTEIDALVPQYVDLKMKSQQSTFVPDANSTLRLTYGNIKGYQPADAVKFVPFTSVSGMIAKAGLADDYQLNQNVLESWKQYKQDNPDKEIPLCILYNTDTTGGNSGSPVLNSKGQLVGLNFDRVYEATINDYGWDDTYSRSIGLNISFVKWMLTDVAQLPYLNQELKLTIQ